MRITELKPLAEKLEQDAAKCSTITVGLDDYEYRGGGEYGRLIRRGGKTSEFTLTQLSLKQLCRLAKVPFGFFLNSSGTLRNKIMSEWLQDGDRRVVLRLRRDGETTVRAILPENYVALNNYQLIGGMLEMTKQHSKEPLVQILKANPDDVFHVRILFTDNELQEGHYYPGVSVVGSEVGLLPDLRVEVLLFKLRCRNGAVATFGGESWYMRQYEGVEPREVAHFICEASANAGRAGLYMFDQIRKQLGQKLDREGAEQRLLNLLDSRKIDKGLVVKALAEVRNGEVPMTNGEDYGQLFALVAQQYSTNRRLKYERFSGQVLGLVFDRKEVFGVGEDTSDEN